MSSPSHLPPFTCTAPSDQCSAFLSLNRSQCQPKQPVNSSTNNSWTISSRGTFSADWQQSRWNPPIKPVVLGRAEIYCLQPPGREWCYSNDSLKLGGHTLRLSQVVCLGRHRRTIGPHPNTKVNTDIEKLEIEQFCHFSNNCPHVCVYLFGVSIESSTVFYNRGYDCL